MKALKNPKILIPIVIALIALGGFAAAIMNGDGMSSPHGHEH